MKKPEKIMSRQEMRGILEEIARDPDSYPSSRVSAIRLLNELGPLADSSQVDDLYDAVPLRRSGRRSR